MDNILQQFINHLLVIGLTNANSLNDFISVYCQVSEQSKLKSEPKGNDIQLGEVLSLKDRIVQSIVVYLDSLNTNAKHELALNIYMSFIRNCFQERLDKAKSLLMIYGLAQRKRIQRKKVIKFKQWKKLSKAGTSSTFINFSMITDKSNRCNKNSGSLESSRFIKEQEELRHCTFQPLINRSYCDKLAGYNSNNNNSKDCSVISVHDRLYTEHKRLSSRRELKALERDNQMAQANTFQPTLVSTSSKDLSRNFNERLKSFENKRINNKEKIIEEIESNHSKKCSFSPNIAITQRKRSFSKSPSTRTIPVHERLYKQNEVQIRNNIRRQMEIEKEIKLQASPSLNSIQFQQNQNQNQNPYGYQQQSQVDYKKIESLYNDYKKMKTKADQKREKIDKEQGLTFKPKLCLNEKYRSKENNNLNFYERENKFVEDKKQFVDIFNQIVDEQARGKRWGNGNYTSKERDEIAQSVVERLYVKGARDRGMGSNNNSSMKIIEDSKNENNTASNIQTNSDEYRVCQLPVAYENKPRHNNMY